MRFRVLEDGTVYAFWEAVQVGAMFPAPTFSLPKDGVRS